MSGCGRFVACVVLTAAAAGCSGTAQDPEALFAGAVAASRRGDTSRALAVVAEGSRRCRGVAPWSARFDLLRAEIVLATGGADGLAEAERLIAGAYDAAHDDGTVRARWTYLRGYAAYKHAAYDDAAPILHAAVRLSSEAAAPDVAIDAYLLLGATANRLQRPADSERYAEEASRLAGETGDRFRAAAAFVNLGKLRLQAFRFDEAITLLERARELAAQAGADVLQAAAVGNLSLCWREVGDLDRAVAARLDAIEVQRRAAVSTHVCQSLGELGNLRRARGEFPAAIASLREAIALARSLEVPAETALWSVELARTLVAAGETAEAPAWIAAARSGFRSTGDALGLAIADLADGDLAAARGDDAAAIRRYETVLAAAPDVPDMVWQAQAGAANALRRIGQPDRARERFAAAAAAIDQGRDRLFRTESRLGFLTEPIRVYQDYVALLVDLGLEDDALAAVEASRARTLFETGGASPRERPTVRAMVRTAREHDVVLLSYWISPRGSFAWIFRRDGARRVPLADTERLRALVDVHRGVIEQGWRDPLESGSAAARELYAGLVGPIRELLPENARVIVVPDGPLHDLNLETLIVDGARPHYLVEDFTVEVAPALTPLLDGAPRAIRGAPAVLLVGDPEPSDPAFPRLPHAAEELEAIEARLPSARIDRLTGRAATPAALLAVPLERYAWLHFAAHAQSIVGNPLDASIVLSDGPAGPKLYARELVARRLGAKLVTLSACRSAGARAYSGEGMVGLAWVFMKAGATQVIAGLWDVSDRSTVDLMDGFYARLGRGASPCDALRDAKLELMRASPTTAKPFHWAPFQLYTRTAAR